jgi:hypothetical protein
MLEEHPARGGQREYIIDDLLDEYGNKGWCTS